MKNFSLGSGYEVYKPNEQKGVFQPDWSEWVAGVYAGDPSKLSMKAAFGKVWKLEEIGGSIIGGTIKMIQERQKNPPPPRDE